MEHRKETVFIVEWIELPDELKKYISYQYDHCFANDTLVEFQSEFEPCDEKHYGETLSLEEIAKYHKDQVFSNGFEGDLDKFIEEYGLKFEVWMLKQGFDLIGVKIILINISW